MLDRLIRALAEPRKSAPDIQLLAKATVAAGGAWWLALLLPGHDQPYFAPLAALVGVYPTVLSSMREAGRFAVGFLLGVLLAVPVSLLFGQGLWGILVVVPAALLLGTWRKLAGQGLQVPFTALFVLLVGGTAPASYALPRLADVVIGVTMGIVVNVVLPPPLRRAEAGEAAYRLGLRTAELLRDTAAEIREGALYGSAHRTERLLAVHRTTLHVADAQLTAAESHRFNARSRLARQHPPLPAHTVLDSLYAAGEQARVLTREARRGGAGSDPSLLSTGFRAEFGDLLDLLAGLAAECGRSGQGPSEERLEEAWACYRSVRTPAMETYGVDGEEAPNRHLAQTQLCALALQLLFDLVPESAEVTPVEAVGAAAR
ncbi:FUSC family protein [Streptomyces sp. bgisy100]|uniref:FUSC family protein n=1 Tax=Streptomyces sp. bgisy100 TaxID=3413783 RepID=UPI003D727141